MRVALILIAGLSPGVAQQSDRFKNPSVAVNHDLTTAEFFKDLGGSFRSLISVQSTVPVLATGAAYGLATIPEQSLEAHFAPGEVWGNWSAAGSYIGNPLILGGLSGTLFAISRKSKDVRFRSLSYALVHGSIMSSALVHPTKAAFRRLRPNGEDKYSFPSGHASDSFMYATVLAEHYGWKAAVPAYAVASYVAATRMVDRKHHITDVVAGAGIGILIGRTVSRRMRTGAPSKLTVSAYRTGDGFVGLVRIGLR